MIENFTQSSFLPQKIKNRECGYAVYVDITRQRRRDKNICLFAYWFLFYFLVILMRDFIHLYCKIFSFNIYWRRSDCVFLFVRGVILCLNCDFLCFLGCNIFIIRKVFTHTYFRCNYTFDFEQKLEFNFFFYLKIYINLNK